MKCLIFRKCLDQVRDNPSADANVRVNCVCCGGIVQEDIINDEERKEENVKVAAKQGKAIETDLSQSCKPRRTRVSSCFSCCCKCVSEEDQRMAS